MEPEAWTPVVAGGVGSWRLVLQRRPLPRGRLVALYDGLAPTWAARRAAWGFDEAYGRLLGGRLGARVAEALTLGSLVDVGCGDAGLAVACVRAHGARDVVLVDAAPAMLAVASERLVALGCTVQAHQARAEVLPLASGSAGVVLVGHVLEHLADPAPALEEARRLLAPGGLLVVVATRCAVVGRWLQARWRLRCHDALEAERALHAAGFAGEVAELEGSWSVRRASLAWIGHAGAPHPG